MPDPFLKAKFVGLGHREVRRDRRQRARGTVMVTEEEFSGVYYSVAGLR
jgi:hypothetical protein